MNVLFGHRVTSRLQELYINSLKDKAELIFPSELNEKTFLELANKVDIFVGYKVTSRFLKEAIRLKHVQVPWTGSETLDFNLLKNYPNITVSNSHSNSSAIAEHAIALLLTAAKNIAYSDKKMRLGDWGPRYETDNDGFWLFKKILGVIGYGAIGKKVACMLRDGFQMKVLAIKRNVPLEDVDSCYDFVGTFSDLPYVLKESDFLLVALPLTRETKGIIGEKELSMMKSSSVIVNIARGAIIKEKALYEHLRDRKIGGAGIDVWYNYPKDRKNPTNVFQNYPFHELDNIVMTPHAAHKVVEREKTFSEDIIRNILLVIEGKKPKNLLNLEAGY